ncbi:hypothetical protein CCP3SC15_420018 [Gammaproteobacteria bacterium]
MSSQSEIYAFIDAVKARLTTNAATIGNPTIFERDDKPFKVADGLLELPVLYVIPLADAADDIMMQWPDGSLEHDFQFSILGYYEAAIADLNSVDGQEQRRLILGYLYNIVDLFKGPAATLTAGNIYRATLEIGYFDDKGNVIAGGVITFSVKMMTQP